MILIFCIFLYDFDFLYFLYFLYFFVFFDFFV